MDPFAEALAGPEGFDYRGGSAPITASRTRFMGESELPRPGRPSSCCDPALLAINTNARDSNLNTNFMLINRYMTIPSTRSYNYGADDFMVTGTMAGASQVVLLAAGMDSRAFRLRIPPTTKVFELDKQALFDIKEPILHAMKAQPACQRVVIPVDLATEDWENHLVEAGFDWCGPKWKH